MRNSSGRGEKGKVNPGIICNRDHIARKGKHHIILEFLTQLKSHPSLPYLQHNKNTSVILFSDCGAGIPGECKEWTSTGYDLQIKPGSTFNY